MVRTEGVCAVWHNMLGLEEKDEEIVFHLCVSSFLFSFYMPSWEISQVLTENEAGSDELHQAAPTLALRHLTTGSC